MEGLLKIDRGWLLAALFLAGFVVYIPALKAPFFWDDYIAIPEIQPYRGIAHTESRPLRAASFYVDSFLWKGNPAGYHFTNIILNSAAGVLVFFFLQQFFLNQAASFIVSLLFILHPLHTETVVWINNRPEMFFLIFFILTFLTRNVSILLSSALFVLCALSKETSVIYPVLLTLYIFFFETEKRYARTAPFYAIALVRGAYGLFFAEKVVGPGSPGGLSDHAAIIFNTYSFYLGKLFLPVQMLVDHQPPVGFSLLSLAVFLSLAAAVFLPKIDKVWRFFLALLFISILPYSNLVYIAGRPLAEQRMYLPSLAFTTLLFLAITALVKRGGIRMALLSGAILFYSGATIIRAKEWRDPELLWKQAAARYPASARIKNNLADVYYERGDYSQAKKYYLQALGQAPDTDTYLIAAQSLALVSMKQDELGEAERVLKGILAVKPENEAALYNLALVCMKLEKYGEAAAYLEKARKILPDAKQIFNNLAVSYMNSGRLDEAAAVLKEAVTKDPGYLNGTYNLIVIYKKAGRKQEALAETERALKAFPGHPAFLRLYQELKV